MTAIQMEKSSGVARIWLDRPPVNALTIALYDEIADLFEQTAQWDDVHCVILSARGNRAFCAGLDLHEFLAATPEEDPERARIVRRMFSAVRHAVMPVIAAVNGPALGAGCVLASVCDIRIAAEKATFGLPEINVGRCGGAAHIGRLVPQSILRRMLFTGQPIDAHEAYRVGLVSDVVPDEQLQTMADKLAATIAAKAPLGLRLGKESVNRVEFMSVEAGYELEQTYSTRLMKSEDAREATRAALEKRPPVFTSR